MQAVRKLLILSHRYIGIPLSFMFVLWFASAFLMIYTGGMPRITPEMRVEGAAPMDFSRVRLSAAEAARQMGFPPSAASLRMFLGRPAYDFSERGYNGPIIFADNGEELGSLSQEQAARVAADFLEIPARQFTYQETLREVDQWTLTLGGQLPMYRFSAADGLGTEAYVSADAASVSVYTTTRSRALAWLSTIPHWLYFSSLRLNQPLWYDLVVWASAIGCIMALLGLCLGVTQFRRVRPFSLRRAIPYRGLMRWHYLLGTVFGIFTLTWVFSGLLSMEPFAWTRDPSLAISPDVYREGELDLSAFPAPDAGRWSGLVDGEIKAVEHVWIQGQPYYLASYSQASSLGMSKRDRLHQPYGIIGQAEAGARLIDARTFQAVDGFDVPTLVAKLEAAAGGARVTDYAVLPEYDDYYYSRNGQLPLPVLRVKFDDPNESWLYVDPRQSRLLTAIGDWSRVERWLYNGLHSLDFAFWYHRRPLWDIGVIVLLMGGLLTSCIGLYFGLRRLKRDLQGLGGKTRAALREYRRPSLSPSKPRLPPYG